MEIRVRVAVGSALRPSLRMALETLPSTRTDSSFVLSAQCDHSLG